MSQTAVVLLGLALSAAAVLAEEPPANCCPAGWDCVSRPACDQNGGSPPVVIVTGRNVRRGRHLPAAHRVPKNTGHHRTE